MGIEMCRGLAALMVLLTHYAPFIPGAPAGLGFLWTGVDLFFVISGYVFAPLLLAGPQGPPLDHKAFFLRRFFRIYPLYLLALLAYWLSQPGGPQSTVYLFRHLLFLHTTRSFEEAYWFNPAFWSLPVEIEFYLLLPLLALLGTRRLGALGVASLVLALVANTLRGPLGEVDLWRVLSVHLTAILPEFLAGTLLYQQVLQGRTQGLDWRSRRALGAMAGGAGLLLWCYLLRYGGLGLDQIRILDAPFNLLSAGAYALLMYPLLLARDTTWTPGLSRIAVAAGASSYGVYLFHNLSPRLLRGLGLEPLGWTFTLLATLLTFVLAALLYRVYENPLRQFGRRLGRKERILPSSPVKAAE